MRTGGHDGRVFPIRLHHEIYLGNPRRTEFGIDMLKLIARELDAPAVSLLDMPERYCQSYGMMFTDPGQHGHEADGTEAKDCCRWCYEDDCNTYEATMDEMIEGCTPRMAGLMGRTVDACALLLGAVASTLAAGLGPALWFRVSSGVRRADDSTFPRHLRRWQTIIVNDGRNGEGSFGWAVEGADGYRAASLARRLSGMGTGLISRPAIDHLYSCPVGFMHVFRLRAVACEAILSGLSISRGCVWHVLPCGSEAG